jgi:hypothetical protein
MLLSAMWLESALFRPYLRPQVPLFPFPGLWPSLWAVWLPPLFAVLLMLGIRRFFRRSTWLFGMMMAPPGAYLLADAINFSTHLLRWRQSLDVRLPAVFLILTVFILAISQSAAQGRHRGAGASVLG